MQLAVELLRVLHLNLDLVCLLVVAAKLVGDQGGCMGDVRLFEHLNEQRVLDQVLPIDLANFQVAEVGYLSVEALGVKVLVQLCGDLGEGQVLDDSHLGIVMD